MKPGYYFSRNLILETERLLLRKILPSDAPDMYDYAKRPETSRYLLWYPHSSLSATLELIRYFQKEYSSGSFYDLGIIYKPTGKMIGTVGLTSYDDKNRCAELGYVLSPDYWHMGLAPEALSAMMNFAFCELGAHRAEARYIEENQNSRRVMEKCGMHFEGIAKGKMYVKGAYRNIGCCALLSDEYFSVPRENIYGSRKKTSILDRIINRRNKN